MNLSVFNTCALPLLPVVPRSSFPDFSSKHQKDERYKGIEKMRDRESYFNEYIQELRKKEKEESKAKKEQVS
jgi:transcription elongation regulator 1